jgi:hypothetical protein
VEERDEIQVQETVAEVAEETAGAGAGAETGAGESTTTAEVTGPEPGTIVLDENGDISIADDVLDEVAGVPPADEASVEKAVEKAETYTPDELAKAFIENTIDPNKVPAGVLDYYKAIAAEDQRRAELRAIEQRDLVAKQPIQPPVQPVIGPLQMTAKDFATLQENGKKLAAKYLGIKPEDYDEFDSAHVNAFNTATADIKARAEQIHAQRQQQAVQAYQQQAQMYQQQQMAVRAQSLEGLVKEFQQNPNWNDIDKNFYPTWHASLDVNTKAAVDKIVAEGSPDKVKQVMKVVFAAYDAQHGKAQPVKKIEATPDIMPASNNSDIRENKGMADTSKLGDMTAEEKAAWFIQNKFV